MYEENTNKEKKKTKARVEQLVENDTVVEENTKNRKSISFKADWVSILIKMAIFLFFVFLIIFGITKFRQWNENRTFKKNMETMKNAAYVYFKEDANRPVLVDEEIGMSLQDMISADLIETLKLNKKTFCSTEKSNVSLRRNDTSKYNLKVYLVCGDKEKEENYSLYYRENSTVSSNNEEKTASKTTNSNSTTNTKTNENKEEETRTLYEQQRKVGEVAKYACPDGYTLSGSSCYSDVNLLSTNAVPKYTVTPEKSVKALYTKGEEKTVYTDYIVNSSEKVYNCPDGYTLKGTTCEKVINATLSNKTEYRCPSGKLVGTKCLIEADIKKITTYKCSQGTLTGNTKCELTTSVKTSCSKGTYSASKDTCVVKIPANTIYSDWQYVKEVSTTGTFKSTETVKYVYIKTVDGRNVYKKYTRKKTKVCSEGTLSGSKCIYNDRSLIVKSCSDSSYKLNSDKTKCYKYVNKLVTKTYMTCPTGYTKSNGKCVKYVKAASQTYNNYSCPDGYTLSNVKKCVKTTEATAKSNAMITCPEGYKKQIKDEKIVCSKTVTTEGSYSCSDVNAKLIDNYCVTPSYTVFAGYNCPTGYSLSGDMCYSYTKSERISATKVSGGYTRTETIWSEKQYLDGWSWTGKTKKV